jgi:hypothetical protein
VDPITKYSRKSSTMSGLMEGQRTNVEKEGQEHGESKVRERENESIF